MIRIILLMALIVRWTALSTPVAAQPQPPTPEQQVLAQLAAEAWQREATLRVQVLTLQAELAKAKSTPDAPKAPAPP